MVAAKLRSKSRLLDEIILSKCWVKSFVKVFLKGSIMDIGWTWLRIKSQLDFFGIKKRFENFQTIGTFCR